jgi:hypothetical protein
MIIYNFDAITYEYTNEGLADLNPLEPGEWLIPAYATVVTPPTVDINEIPIWNDNSWIIAPDFRGQPIWNKITLEQSVVKIIGPISSEYTLIEPPNYNSKWDINTWVIDILVQEENIKKELISSVSRHLDQIAQSRNYDNILSLCTYATSTNPIFALEGQAGIQWRDEVWTYCYQVLYDCSNGLRAIPTSSELISELPVISW